MEPVYYNAAAKGDIGDFKNIPKPLNQLLTPNRNTVLHIYLTSLIKRSEDSKSSTDFVEEILTKCPILLWQANVKGETPLHIAARYGHAAIVDVLIEHAKAPQEDLENGVNNTVQKMLEMMNNEKDTALHEAVRGNHRKVVERLIEEGTAFHILRMMPVRLHFTWLWREDLKKWRFTFWKPANHRLMMVPLVEQRCMLQ